MKRALAFIAMLAACGNDIRGVDTGAMGTPYSKCGADTASFVRQSFLALAGRRPLSQAEVDVYVDLYDATEDAGGDPKDAVARAIMMSPEFSDRWIETFMDALHVQRLDIQNEASCWDDTLRATVSDSLARGVRDGAATGGGDAGGSWTMLDLARSAIALDDVTPLYRAQLFSMVAHPIPAANVPDREAELARRADFGATFDAAYLHRDIVCLGCHTSERSVTDDSEADRDRHWPVPGAPEAAVFGMSNGVAEDRAHAAFRVASFLDGADRPWGWTSACGTFERNVGDDIAGVDAKLASVTGTRATVYDLEQALQRGFDKLRGQLPPIGDTGTISDPDTALAWLVTLKITEDVFKRATGTPLTIANYFPRNAAASDLLYSLASQFTQSGYSVKALLAAIVTSDYFNRQPAELGCGEHPYTYPAVFDPWVTAERIRERRGNGPGDAITAVDARTLISATAAALEWTAPPAASRFPDYGETGCDGYECDELEGACSLRGRCCTSFRVACEMNGVEPFKQVPFERAVGLFLRNSEAGFRGFDFQARLAWEERYGACTKPRWVSSDFIDAIIAAGAATSGATVRDVVAAIKDRLVGEPEVFTAEEEDALVGLLGADLTAPATSVTPAAARQLCGALVGSPQYLLQGMAARGGERPLLTPAAVDYDAVCATLATRLAVTCDHGTLALRP
jgi:hypothetical protein